MANLFLYYYENKQILKTKLSNLKHVRLFGNTFRFIDDLIALNDGGLFQKSYTQLYPPEPEIKKGNKNKTETTFFDLLIKMIHKQFQISICDKKDFFPFSVKIMFYLDSGMPSRIFYSSIGAEILGIGRANNTNWIFYNAAKTNLQRNKVGN